MFNRSWYKNTWLGKKLGFKIEWNTENLVKSDGTLYGTTVIHTYDGDNEVYTGFKLVKQYTHDGSNKMLEKIIEVNTSVSELEVLEGGYTIVYDPTKLEALLKIKKLEEKIADEEARFTVKPAWNLYYSNENQKDFTLSKDFLDKAGSLILRIIDYKSLNGKVLEKIIVCKRNNLDIVKYLYQTN